MAVQKIDSAFKVLIGFRPLCHDLNDCILLCSAKNVTMYHDKNDQEPVSCYSSSLGVIWLRTYLFD